MAKDGGFDGKGHFEGLSAVLPRNRWWMKSPDRVPKSLLLPPEGLGGFCAEGNPFYDVREIQGEETSGKRPRSHGGGIQGGKGFLEAEKFTGAFSQVQAQVSRALKDPHLPEPFH